MIRRDPSECDVVRVHTGAYLTMRGAPPPATTQFVADVRSIGGDRELLEVRDAQHLVDLFRRLKPTRIVYFAARGELGRVEAQVRAAAVIAIARGPR